MDEIKHDIVEKFGCISETKSGWKTELNLVSWGERPAKYDLRPWSPDGQKMGKGITLTKDEIKALKEILNQMNLD